MAVIKCTGSRDYELETKQESPWQQSLWRADNRNFIMDDAEEYFGLLIAQHASVVATMLQCVIGEAGKTASA